MINNGTIFLDEVGLGRLLGNETSERVPILQVAVSPGRDSNKDNLAFTWNVTQQGTR
jgi:hypothetical protein